MNAISGPAALSDVTDSCDRQAALPADQLYVESLDIEAQGIAHRKDGKVVFIDGALPFEVVSVKTNRIKASYEKATVTAVHHESSQRVKPQCPHFGLHEGACGGCKMQHLHAGAQVAVKQRALEDNLWHLGQSKSRQYFASDSGPRLGLSLPGTLVSTVRSQEGRSAGWFS